VVWKFLKFGYLGRPGAKGQAFFGKTHGGRKNREKIRVLRVIKILLKGLILLLKNFRVNLIPFFGIWSSFGGTTPL